MSLGAVNPFSEALRRAVTGGFEAQASAHGAALHARAVAIRAKDPLATFLVDTFSRQVPRYGAAAQEAHAAGDRLRAVEMGLACERAAGNLKLVREAVEGR